MERTKNSFKNNIIKDARQQRKKYRESGAWLYDAIKFNHGHYLISERDKTIANRLFNSLQLQGGYKLEQKQKDFEILLANLFNQTRKPIRVSFKVSAWKKAYYNKSSYFTITLINILNSENLINMVPGNCIKNENGKITRSRQTRIWATENLLKLFPASHSGVGYKPVSVIELWSIKRINKRKIKSLIDYRDTAETWRIREILERANEVNNKANIMFAENSKSLKLTTGLIAKFTNKLTLGGRLYTHGISHYQGLLKQERRDITIDGHPTVEIDYSGLHPMLLYAAEGIQYRGDPYSLIESNPIARPFLKTILLCMINTDFVWAQRAANNTLLNKYSKQQREELAQISITRAGPLMKKFIEVHKPIAHYLCTGHETGLRLMNKDAKIALDIINHFIKQDIPILCIHDSFIIRQLYADELEKVMKEIYRRHTRHPERPEGFRCETERKY